MAGKTISIMELRQIIQLKQKGVSHRQIAEQLSINRNTVNQYVRTMHTLDKSYEALLALDDAALSQLLVATSEKSQPRYQELAQEFETIHRELKKPGATLYTIWQGYKARHPQGYQYTQFTHYYRQWAHPQKSSLKLTHKAGAKLYVDYTGKKLPVVNADTGEYFYPEFFVAILPSSHYIYCEATMSQQRDDFIGSLGRCLAFLGGSPQAIIPDNLKSAVTKPHKYAPVINKTLRDFGLHYNCVIDPARPYQPQDKALVENAVRLVYQKIFYYLSGQTFFSLQELNEAIYPLMLQLNEHMFSQVNYSRRELFLSAEKSHLQPLPSTPYEIKYYKRAKVQKMSHILLSEDKHYYSVPYRYIGKQVEVQYSASTVEIYYNHQRLCLHKRDKTPGRYSTQPDHLPSTHQAYSQWNLDYFTQKAGGIGPYTAQYISQLILQYAYPEKGYKQAQGLIHLTKEYTKTRIENACKRGLQGYRYGFHIISNILEKGLDRLEESNGEDTLIPAHENQRGPEHYK